MFQCRLLFSLTYFLAMALLPVVLFLAAVLLPSFPTEAKVRLKWKNLSRAMKAALWDGKAL